MNFQKRTIKKKHAENGFAMVTILTFMPLIAILSVLTISLAIQSYRTTLNQELIRQAQLASMTAMDYAKEQYELDVNYTGTAETVLYTNSLYEVSYEVESLGFTNGNNTQQDIKGIGRVYKTGETTPQYKREIIGKITYTSGSTSSVRFIFIIDNSGSMNQTDWTQSKGSVDASILHVLANAPTAQVAVVQFGTNHYTREHTYDVTVPFTQDTVTATNWNRKFGPGSAEPSFFQDHLPGSLAQMRIDSVYGPGDELDLAGATNIQYVLFTDALGINTSWCCSSLKKVASEPSGWHDNNGAGYSILENYGEYDALKDGTVFAGDGYSDLTSQFTVLNIETAGSAVPVSASLSSVGGSWNGSIDANPDDPEGDSVLPRRFISTTLAAGPDEIISLLQEIIEDEINI